MTDLTVNAGAVALAKGSDVGLVKFTGPAAETITAGQYCRFDATTGQITPGNASSAGEAALGGIALNGGSAGVTVTIVHQGLVDLGKDVLTTLNFGASVFLSDTDGKLADGAGTVSKVVGVVVPAWGNTTADRLLYVQGA